MGLLFTRRGTDPSLPKADRGAGDFNDFGYDLVARRKSVKIVLAASDPHQDELRDLAAQRGVELRTAISPRSIEQERVDAEIPVRLFADRRVSGVVGTVPRGLESIVDETLRRLEDRGDAPRIPVRIVSKGGSYRVELLMGAVR